VIGTTGLNDKDMKEMQDAAKGCPLLWSANMSVGVNLLAALVEQASAKLGPAFDIEIAETHHRNKIDAPSGTALMLGKATGRAAAPIDRSGKRETGTLGYSVQRGGDVIGDHTVSFFGASERIELSHRAGDRSLFAKGALRAAEWLAEKPNGFYSMRDVLAL
jgi:4-hydroxy-tetrahydrodipicolinate reductase